MSEPLGKITPKKIPASQAIPGNAQHAQLIQTAQQSGSGKPNVSGNWARNVKTGVIGPTMAGLAVITLFIAAFGYWAASAPLSGAAVANGVITASGQNLHVQHLEGGIIDEILVVEGEAVTKGQPLLSLDPTNAKATRDRLAHSLIGLKARDERLRAERDGVHFEFSTELIKAAKAAGLDADLEQQVREFNKRSRLYASDAKIVDQQVSALKEQISGLEIQIKSTRSQLAVLEDEIAVKAKLVKRKLTPRSVLLRLRREHSELEGRIGRTTANIGQALSSIARSQEQKIRLQAQRQETAITQLNEGRTRLAEIRELIRTAEDVLERVVVRAPEDGVVININKNTRGSVVRHGEDLVILLPKGGELIVEARLSVQDIDVVSEGQQASLRFATLNSRTTPEVPGTIYYISADRQIDPITQEQYYLARVKISEVLPETIKRSQIFPGMPVETYIQTGDRTFFEYLIKPLRDSFNRSFREE